MDFTEFTTRYSNLSDDELLVFLADRDTLVPEAAIALDTEVQLPQATASSSGLKSTISKLPSRAPANSTPQSCWSPTSTPRLGTTNSGSATPTAT